MSNTKESESKSVWAKPWYGPIEYEMPKEMAKQLLATRKGEERNMQPQTFLCKVVNEEFGLLGNCIKITTY